MIVGFLNHVPEFFILVMIFYELTFMKTELPETVILPKAGSIVIYFSVGDYYSLKATSGLNIYIGVHILS